MQLHIFQVDAFISSVFGANPAPVCPLGWAFRLGSNTIHAYQVSARGGELFCRLAGVRLLLAGHAVKYMEGTLYLA